MFRDLDEPKVRKNYNLQQSLIDEAKLILGASTETEAIELALQLAAFGGTMAQGTSEMLGEEYLDDFGFGATE